MKHVPALDGIRAVAVLLVIVAHFGPPNFADGAGTIGVDIFFTLSGFLITSILLSEYSRDGTISLRSFYRRRVLRLWPALVAVLAIYAAAAPLISTVPNLHYKAALAAALSYMNWYQAIAHSPEGFVGHAWSLSIEEQFYLIWPALLVVLLRLGTRKAAITTSSILLLGGIAWRGYLTHLGVPPIRIYAGTDTHADPLLIGCLLAISTLPAIFREWLARTWAVAAMAVVAVALTPGWTTRNFMWEFTASGFLGAWLILAVMHRKSCALIAALSSSPMAWLGRRSYGIYLWHVPVMKVLVFATLSPGSRAAVGIPAALLIAAASYRFVEEPLTRRGRSVGKVSLMHRSDFPVRSVVD